jgi:hypothetical protein
MFMGSYKTYADLTMKITVFLDVTPCSLVDRYQHFRGGLNAEVVGSSSTLVPVYQTVWCHIPEDSNQPKLT